jgi:predicted amidohydrolase
LQDVRIAAVQMRSVVGEVDRNLASVKRLARKAADSGAEIVCFPELSISGYNTAERDGKPMRGEVLPAPEAVPGPSTDALAKISADAGVWLLAGLLEQDRSGIIYNTQVVVSPDGYLGRYRKTHVPTTEIGTWCQGDDLPVFEHPKVRFGVEICYDSHFPEVSTALANAGAELILMPHASGGVEPAPAKRARWERYVPARAYDNSVYTAICNQVGDNGAGQVFQGVSFVCDPRGEVIAACQSFKREEIVLADLTAAGLNTARSVPEAFFRHFRRPHLYDKWRGGA